MAGLSREFSPRKAESPSRAYWSGIYLVLKGLTFDDSAFLTPAMKPPAKANSEKTRIVMIVAIRLDGPSRDTIGGGTDLECQFVRIVCVVNDKGRVGVVSG